MEWLGIKKNKNVKYLYFHKKDVLQKEKGENIVQYPQIMLSFVPTTIKRFITI